MKTPSSQSLALASAAVPATLCAATSAQSNQGYTEPYYDQYEPVSIEDKVMRVIKDVRGSPTRFTHWTSQYTRAEIAVKIATTGPSAASMGGEGRTTMTMIESYLGVVQHRLRSASVPSRH